jgi:Fe-S cluster assembly protein SufD
VSKSNGNGAGGTTRWHDDWAAFHKDDAVAVPRWARKLRDRAMARFAELGVPTTRNEDWHFTSPAPIAEAEFSALRTASGAVRPDELAPFRFGEAGWPTMVFVNGRYDADLSSVARLPQGLTLVPLAEAWTSHEELLERHLGTIAVHDDQAFTALNAAFAYDGALVVVGKEMEIEEPVHLVFVTDSNAAKGAMHPRVLIARADRRRAPLEGDRDRELGDDG